MMTRSLTIVAMVAAFAAADLTTSMAAEITLGRFQNVVLEGKIEAGDFVKLRKHIAETDGFLSGIYLASPGGDLAEAIRIGRLVRALRWETLIPGNFSDPLNMRAMAARHGLKDEKRNYMCASACFFVFVAGIFRTDELGDAILGIHRPYLTTDDLKVLSGDQAIFSANRLRATVENYLKEMSVPAKYADLMFSVPPDQIRWINKTDFDMDLSGFIPDLRDWINAKCDKRTDLEKAIAKILEGKRSARQKFTEEERRARVLLDKMLEQQVKCEIETRDELSRTAWRQMFKK